MARAETTVLAIDVIRRDGGTQSREALNDGTVETYAEKMRDGAQLGAVVVFFDGTHYWLADGFHRVAACERAGIPQCAAEVRQGSQRDAVLYSCGANDEHGLPRTNADKRRAVLTLLHDTEWSKQSDGQVARLCRVTQPFVSKLRGECPTQNGYESTRTGADGRTINTANIGKRAAEVPPVSTSTTGPKPAATPSNPRPEARDDHDVDPGEDDGEREVVREVVTAPSPDRATSAHSTDLDEQRSAAAFMAALVEIESRIVAAFGVPVSPISMRNEALRRGCEGSIVRVVHALAAHMPPEFTNTEAPRWQPRIVAGGKK